MHEVINGLIVFFFFQNLFKSSVSGSGSSIFQILTINKKINITCAKFFNFKKKEKKPIWIVRDKKSNGGKGAGGREEGRKGGREGEGIKEQKKKKKILQIAEIVKCSPEN